MITKINKIRDLPAVFNKFDWNVSIPDFKKYNAIYGWNYSGKTLLSRIFRSFEIGQVHNDYDRATFEIEMDNGTKYNQLNLNQQFAVRVFNSDFVKENLKWAGDIEPVLILGEENISLQKQLDEYKNSLDEKKKTIANLQIDKRTKEEKIETALTDKARDIKNTLSIPDYDKTKFKPIVEEIASAPDTTLLSDEQKQDYLKNYRSTAKEEKIQAITLSIPDMPALCGQTQALLKRTPATARIIERLRKEPTIEKWVREGKELHKDKSHCEFCGGKLPDDLLDKLNAYFSADYENLLNEIEQFVTNLENKKGSLDLPDKARFYSELQNEYEQTKSRLKSEMESCNNNIDKLIMTLNPKKSQLFEAITIENPLDSTKQLQTEIGKTNRIIQKHNNKTDNFEKEKEEAKENLIKHWASEFVISEKYKETLTEIHNTSELEKQKNEQEAIRDKINEIEQQLSDTAKGAEAVNQHLRSYFGTDEIKIEVTGDDKFKLVRSGFDVKNLSEGEKTAIAFAYFMTKLVDKNTTLTNTIVFIDDPVSSLDCNHLFHTYSLIKNELADCEQIFISTHNFEFFNLIKDWFKEDKEHKRNSSFYLIEKLKNASATNSKLSELPELLLKFKSEYAYLFSLLYNFNKQQEQDYDRLYILPNIVRRYLEAFVGFKVLGGLSKNLSILIKGQQQQDKVNKFIQEYSHNQSSLRILNFPDFSECKDVVDTVLEAVENKDKEHFSALVAKINDQYSKS